MELLKTAYDWCVLERTRPIKLLDWETSKADPEEAFFEEKIPYSDFIARARLCEMKPNSTPRKTPRYLIYRMYGFVPYNIKPIQQGIQFGHAVVEYGQWSKVLSKHEIPYDKFANVDKTFIILDGGTTNNNPERLGTLNKKMLELSENNIRHAPFFEPDLNDALTAVVFLVDERVFDRETYPDFVRNEFGSDEDNQRQYDHWVEKVGGPSNVFLRDWLPKFRRA
jgi:hypothetical protein